MSKCTQFDDEDWQDFLDICRFVDDGGACGLDAWCPDIKGCNEPTGSIPADTPATQS